MIRREGEGEWIRLRAGVAQQGGGTGAQKLKAEGRKVEGQADVCRRRTKGARLVRRRCAALAWAHGTPHPQLLQPGSPLAVRLRRYQAAALSPRL